MRKLFFERKIQYERGYFRIPKKLQFFVNKLKKKLKIANDQDFVYYVLIDYLQKNLNSISNEDLLELRKTRFRKLGTVKKMLEVSGGKKDKVPRTRAKKKKRKKPQRKPFEPLY